MNENNNNKNKRATPKGDIPDIRSKLDVLTPLCIQRFNKNIEGSAFPGESKISDINPVFLK